jgi:iron uptake system component EfeO
MAMVLALLALACSGDNDKLDLEQNAIAGVKQYVGDELGALATSGDALVAAAPAADADGWAAATDADAVEEAKSHWKTTRIHYERVEGAIAVLFPDLDVSTDERYDGFIATTPDENLFDDQVVTGVHGIERILWADSIPDYVTAFESKLDYYEPASFPTNETAADEFATLLSQRLADDLAEMGTRFEPLALDAAAAYDGVVGSMLEQVEKVSLAQTGEEESRYAQHTAADMRANLEGGREIYGQFSAWVGSADGGEAVDDAVYAGFDRMQAALDAISGESIPPVPETWNPDAPSEADLATPYGQLWSVVQIESDPTADGSLVSEMVAAADLVGIEVAL